MIETVSFSPQIANATFMPSNSLVTTPPGSPASAARESSLVDEQDPLPFVAFVSRKPQAHEGFGGGAGAAVLFAVFAHKKQHLAFAQGDEQQVGGAGLVSEHAQDQVPR
jgi:hypothetical protein